jgi:hypothetical protein
MHILILLRSAPCQEDVHDLSSTYARERLSRAYLGLLRRVIGTEPTRASLTVKQVMQRGLATRIVACLIDVDDGVARQYARECVLKAPLYWDEKALAELARG